MDPLIFLLLVLAALYLVLSTFIRVIYQGKSVRELKRLAITERNRNRFGILRTKLMSLAREEKIDIRSPLFSGLYGCATILMRNPHLYKEAVNDILSFSDEIESTDGLSLSQNECELLVQYAQSLDELCRDYSPVYRHIAKYRDRRSSVPTVPLWIKIREVRQRDQIRRQIEEAEKGAQSIVKAQNNLISLAKEHSPPNSDFRGQLQPV